MKILKSERINLLARSHGYFPAAFRWRGRRFDVTAVEKCWTVALLVPWPKPAAPARFPLPRGQRRPAQRSLPGQPKRLAAPVHAQAERRPTWTTASQRP